MPTRFPVRLENLSALLMGVVVASALFASAAAPRNLTARAEPTRTPEATKKPEPTATAKPEPTKTPVPEPTKKPEPTATPKPEPTKKPEPTATPKPEPTKTPVPEPTKKPEPTATPKPEPTKTPVPTATPKPEPTKTPVPTATTVPTPPPGSIAFAEPSFSVQESAGVATIRVRRVVINGVGASGAVSVKYQTTTGGTASPGTATSAGDYTVVTGTLSWANGDSSVKTFTVPITNDTLSEATETVFLRLYDLSGTGTIAPTRKTATLSILDNDVDTIVPTATIVSPAANALVSNLNVISGTAKDEGGSGLKSVSLLIKRLSDNKFWNGTAWGVDDIRLATQLTGNSWTRTDGNPTRADLSDGTYNIAAIPLDGAENSSRFTESVTIDVTAPNVTISVPASKVALKTLTRAAGLMSETTAGTKVVLYLSRASDHKYWNGHEWATAKALPTQQSASGEWSRTEWPALDVGTYALTAIITDASGNSGSATNAFYIVATSPSGGST